MKLAIAALGVVIAAFGAVAVFSPAVFGDLFGKLSSHATWVLAVILRLAVGTLLLVVAGSLKYPDVMTILGWVAIVAAVVLLLLGPDRLKTLVDWWLSRSDGLLRISAIFVCAFGVFLAYVAV